MTEQSHTKNNSGGASSSLALRDRFLGCLLGCAVGDALGAPYEGLWPHSIPDEDTLMRQFDEFEGYSRGQFTDDTQLTLATIDSILKVGDVSPAHVARSIASLWKKQAVIGPGGACSHAATTFLRTGDWTRCGAAEGQAGNGTAMRTAALGLFFLPEPERLPSTVADVSRITHHDPRSIAGGVAVAKAAQLLATEPIIDPHPFCRAIVETIAPYAPAFAAMVSRLPELIQEPPDVTVRVLAWSGMDRPEFEAPIITPFVIPIVLAALWSLLRHPDSWNRAVACAIRLGGDVDTLGAIVGALSGIQQGEAAIPDHLKETVQQSQRLRNLALRYYSLVAKRSTG